MSVLHRFPDINAYLPNKIKTSRDLNYAHLGTVCHRKTDVSRQPGHKI